MNGERAESEETMLFSDQQIQQIRNQSLEMEQSRGLSASVLQMIYQQRGFKLFVPNEWGGRMTAFPKALRLFEECAWIDGSLGWAVTIGSGGGIFVPLMSASVGRRVFLDAPAVIAGSGTPTGVAIPQDGGYVVNGSWKYCSGSPYATTFTVSAKVDRSEEIRAFILQPNQVEIYPDWHAIGLKATGSHQISVNNVWVPEEMTFTFSQIKNEQDHLIYQYPFLPFSLASFAVVCLGIVRHFLEATQAWVQQKPDWPMERSQSILNCLKAHQEKYEVSRRQFYRTLDSSWEELIHHHQLSDETQQQVMDQSKESARVARTCGQEIFPRLGVSAMMENLPINQIWRDLLTASQHTFLEPWRN